MDDSKERPRPGNPPKLDESLELLMELLAVEKARLVVARRIEEERKIVFPETSVILHDILKIQAEIDRRTENLMPPSPQSSSVSKQARSKDAIVLKNGRQRP